VQLCRNDDYNLAVSCILKKSKGAKAESKVKVLEDMKLREEERSQKE